MRPVHLGLLTLALTACRGDTQAQISSLELENDALTEELAALSATVQALSDSSQQQQGDVAALSDEVQALTGLELSDLLADVADLQTRIDDIESIDIASEGWVADQGYGLASDIDANRARLDTTDTAQQAQDQAIAAATADLETQGLALADQATAIQSVSTLTGEISTAVDTLQTAVSTNAQAVGTNASEISALQEGLQSQGADLVTLQEDLTQAQVDIDATQDSLTTTQEDLSSAQQALTLVETDVAQTQSDLAQTDEGLVQTRSDLAQTDSRLSATQADVGQAQADIEQTLEALGQTQSDVSGLGDRLTEAEASLGDNAAAFASINERIDSVEQTGADERDVLLDAVADNEGRIADLSDELTDGFDLLFDELATVDEKVLGGYPAIWEYQGVGGGYDQAIAQGRGGHLLQTSGGAFSFSGYSGLNYTGGISRVWTATWYVSNPSGGPVSVDWNMCRGDSTQVLLDGDVVTTASDLDGRCGLLANLFSLSPGSHTVQIRYIDSNNWLEGVGVTNPWITESGLRTDWTALKEALELGVAR